MSLRFILYARKSSEGEDRQMKSLADQVSTLRERAKIDGLKIIEVIEESRSAKHPDNRPLFSSMLEAIESGRADAILVWHVNRLVRNKKEAGLVEWMLETGKIRCIYTPERIHWPDDNAILLAVETAMATQYSRDLSNVVSRAVEEKAKRGWWPYRPKIGYQVDPLTHDIEAEREIFAHLRTGWDMMLTKSYTVPEVLDELTARGLRVVSNSRNGSKRIRRPISRATLYRVFNDPFYAGYFEFQGEVREGNHPAMVTLPEFEIVQRFLGRNQHIQPKRREFAFTGLMVCGTCGCLITAEEKHKVYKTTGNESRYTYYHCTGRKGCSKQSVTGDFIDDRILNYFEGSTISPLFAEWVASALERDKGEIPATFDALESSQQQELRDAKDRLETLYDMRERREVTPEEFAERKARLTKSINSLGVAISTRVVRRDAAIDEYTKRLRKAPVAAALFAHGTPKDKRILSTLLAEEYVLTLGNQVPYLDIKAHPLFDLLRTFEPQDRSSQQIGDDDSGGTNPVWRTLLDNIRNQIERDVDLSMERNSSARS